MAQSNFNRVEEKYLLTPLQKEAFLSNIQDHLVDAEFATSHISNIYFDSDANELIEKSISKPKFKEKLRLRCYDIPNDQSEVFFEIKRKVNGVVSKRRISLKMKEYNDYIATGKMPNNHQIMREIDYMIHHYHLHPKIMIAYERDSYIAKDNSNLRITFDHDLRYRYDDLHLESGRQGIAYQGADYIMEIKTLGGFPQWIVDTLSKLEIYPASFSKYGKIYIQNKGEKLC